MPNRLRLTRNAQFYRVNEPITNDVITEILDKASENRIQGSDYLIEVFREEKLIEGQNLRFCYSVNVFPTARPVFFLRDNFSDTILAFILIIEIDQYLAVLKKSCSNILDIMDDYSTLIGSREFSSTFNDDDVEFQKLSIRNMTVSDRAMRTRSYEAVDLKGLLSTHAAGRSIPFYFKLRQGSITKSISGTGRIVESSDREPIDSIAVWVNEQIKLLESPKNSNFLDSFASKVELNDVLASCNPNAILIESTSLFERIQKNDIEILYKLKSGRNIKISKRMFDRLESDLENVYEIDSNLNIIDVFDSKLRVNRKTLTVQSKILSKFRLIDNGKEITLLKFIVKYGLYSITFTDPKFMYFMGACFEDVSGKSEIDSILEILTPIADLKKVVSEKGNFTNSSTKFSEDSMFAVIEALHEQDDYIFCDDLGNEWADHITFNKLKSNISFIHSKCGKVSNSASKLHDVVGQGIKNLGNMYFDTDFLISKVRTTFKKNYISKGSVKTQIASVVFQ
jgi:hypothetical protein